MTADEMMTDVTAKLENAMDKEDETATDGMSGDAAMQKDPASAMAADDMADTDMADTDMADTDMANDDAEAEDDDMEDHDEADDETEAETA